MQPLYVSPVSPAQELNTENITLAEITSEAYYSKAQNTRGVGVGVLPLQWN